MPVVPARGPTLDFDSLRRSVVIYGDYRTGTHLLKLTLGALTGMPAPEEPFNTYIGARDTQPDAPLPPHSFDRVLRDGLLDPVAMVLRPASSLQSYFGYLQGALATDTTAMARPMLIDIKYDQAFRLGAEATRAAPLLLSWLLDRGLPVLHVIRRDALSQAVSMLVARHRRIYLELDGNGGASAPTDMIWLDPTQVLEQARACLRARRAAQTHVARTGARVLTVAYEDMLGDGLAPQMRRVLRFLDHYRDVPSDLRPLTRQQNSLGQVANLAEIIELLVAQDPDLVGRTLA